ncbi:glutathione S-transferase family protein [Paraburkholderia guartelaensis]|uniref:glutathione S-transferase family protein n=1 Tax=Paraburkholderia guartelaensis TaxID=2546446 RepID=UPI002AB7ABEE|nr:glutathione S-transferase N-terminal domain-containing protein [Paraburkholderia guartelaensis]
MQLYGRRSSINVQKVLWCLCELGLAEGTDFQRIEAGLQFGVVDTEAYRALNPNGLVPTLVDGEQVVWESNAILRYLAATRGADHLLPSDAAGRSEVERWMDWQMGTLWATLRVAFLGLTRTVEPQRDYGAIRASFAESARLLRIADERLRTRDYLVLNRFTLADLVVALAAHRWYGLNDRFHALLATHPEMSSLASWLDVQRVRPGFAVALG